MSTLTDFLGRTAKAVLSRELPRSVVTHDSIDDMELGNFREDSPRFKHITENAPVVTPRSTLEDPPDFTTAAPEEIAAWQEKARAEKEAEENAPAYRAWPDLTGDVFRSYHTHDSPEVIEDVDPGVALHKRIMPKLLTQDEHAEARNITRDDPTLAAMATMAATKALKEVLEDELSEQARETEEFEDRRNEARDAEQQLVPLRDEAKGMHEEGKPIPQELVDQITQLVGEKRGAIVAANEIAAEPTPIDSAGVEAIEAAAQAGQDAAEAGKAMPGFGSGFGAGEPTYTSPEQALSIAERWANDPDLKAMAEMYGKMDRDIRFKRSKRIVGGNDEIVDVRFGDNLKRTVPAELALLADEDYEDDFFMRYAAQELLEFSTVGEENAGRGPILIVLDGSGSMHGERNVWARATAMCLLHIARLEKRDFGLIEFSSGGQLEEWMFPAKKLMDPEMVVDMASHLFGGGTTPVIGVTQAAKVMKQSPPFKKADLVLVGDGEASFGPEDEKLRAQLTEMGVRLFGIGIGGSHRYLAQYCEHVVDVHDFELTDPSAATAELATHIT